MKKAYLGIDVGSISAKGVLIDENNNIIANSYLHTEGNPVVATKRVVEELKNKIDLKKYKIVGCGVTGSARKLIGRMFGVNTIKNEITAHANGAISVYKDAKTIIDIGGKNSKIIFLDNGLITDYAMNNLCSSGIGSFLNCQAERLKISVEDLGKYAISSSNPIKITSSCIISMETELRNIKKLRYKKEDVIAGLCYAIVNNYINAVENEIKPPVVFQGGVSKNIGIVKAFEKITGYDVFVDENSHLMGALGVAILSKNEKEIDFSFDIELECKA